MVKEHMTRYEQHAIPQEYGEEYAEIFIKATEPEPEPTVSDVDDQESKHLGDNKNNTIKSDKKSVSKSSKILNNKQTNNNNNNKDNCNDTKTVKNDKIKSEEIKKSVRKMLSDKTRAPTKSPNKICQLLTLSKDL
ncbi:unnamed protein product [Diabrotica balteata]|uniref:Uncharacterized protein n=1 Tax=Diabrotica balteata TaxID=107213 RepID=A0A9N9T049_DIABA|nr:unnamed protein product [Diabrotica balteata]